MAKVLQIISLVVFMCPFFLVVAMVSTFTTLPQAFKNSIFEAEVEVEAELLAFAICLKINY